MKLLSTKASIIVLAVYLPLLIVNALICRSVSLTTDLNILQEVVALGLGALSAGYVVLACISIYYNKYKVQE